MFYSCSPTVKVIIDYDHNTNFDDFRTYTVYDLKAQEGQVNQLNVERVSNAIRTEMNARGFIETTSNPDLKVNAVSILKNKTEIIANNSTYVYGGRYRPYRYWGGSTIVGSANTTFNTYDYVDGSLIIDIVSTKTGKLVWQGIGNAQIGNKPNNPDELVAGAIKKILADFPPDKEKAHN